MKNGKTYNIILNFLTEVTIHSLINGSDRGVKVRLKLSPFHIGR